MSSAAQISSNVPSLATSSFLLPMVIFTCTKSFKAKTKTAGEIHIPPIGFDNL